MTFTFWHIRCALILCAVVVFDVACSHGSEALEQTGQNKRYDAMLLSGQVLSVVDGESFTVRLDDGSIEKVRLIGIDAPDVGQDPRGVESRHALCELLEGKQVMLETDATVRDRHNRLLAHVFVGDVFVNLEMIRQGQATLSKLPSHFSHIEQYRQAQQEAKKAGVGP